MGTRKAPALAVAIGLALCMALVVAAPAMAETGGIRGKVVEAEEIEGLGGVEVCAEAVPPLPVEPPCVETEGGSGAYEITGLEPGRYRVHFQPLNPEFVPQYFLNTVQKSAARVLEVEEGSVKGGIGAALVKGGWVTGTVTDPTGFGLSGIKVCLSAVLLPEMAPSCATTEIAGKYETERLPPGPYTAYFSSESPDIFPQYFSGAASAGEADDVFVFGYNETAGVDARMELGSTINGKVVEAGSEAPLGSIRVCALDSGTAAEVSCAMSGTDGTYSIEGLHPGAYVVAFSVTGEAGGLPILSQEDAYVRQYFEEEASFDAADPIDATVPGVYNDVDARLVKGPEVFPRPSSGSAGAGASSSPPGGSPAPIATLPPRLHCRKHFRAKRINGKRRCVRVHVRHHRHHRRHRGSAG